MNARDIKRLDQLWHLREDRARQVLEEQQLVMDKVIEALQEQRRIVVELEQQIAGAAERSGKDTVLTAAALQSGALHRRSLRSDLGRERYFCEVVADDVRQERRKLNKCRAEWLREHQRLERIPVLKTIDLQSKTRQQLRQESDLFDELSSRSTGLHSHNVEYAP
jgi:hypothetical protein